MNIKKSGTIPCKLSKLVNSVGWINSLQKGRKFHWLLEDHTALWSWAMSKFYLLIESSKTQKEFLLWKNNMMACQSFLRPGAIMPDPGLWGTSVLSQTLLQLDVWLISIMPPPLGLTSRFLKLGGRHTLPWWPSGVFHNEQRVYHHWG